jgi:hypothetical protein
MTIAAANMTCRNVEVASTGMAVLSGR